MAGLGCGVALSEAYSSSLPAGAFCTCLRCGSARVIHHLGSRVKCAVALLQSMSGYSNFGPITSWAYVPVLSLAIVLATSRGLQLMWVRMLMCRQMQLSQAVCRTRSSTGNEKPTGTAASALRPTLWRCASTCTYAPRKRSASVATSGELSLSQCSYLYVTSRFLNCLCAQLSGSPNHEAVAASASMQCSCLKYSPIIADVCLVGCRPWVTVLNCVECMSCSNQRPPHCMIEMLILESRLQVWAVRSGCGNSWSHCYAAVWCQSGLGPCE